MKNAKSCNFKTSIGGQALIEGILMRGPKKQAIVCRTKDGLVEKIEDLKLIKDRYPILGWPLIRGCAIFLHCKSADHWYTAGCVSLTEEDMLALLLMLRDGAYMIIVPDAESIAEY